MSSIALVIFQLTPYGLNAPFFTVLHHFAESVNVSAIDRHTCTIDTEYEVGLPSSDVYTTSMQKFLVRGHTSKFN